MKNRFFLFMALLVTMLCGGHKAMAQSVTIDGITYSYSSEWNGAYVSYINDTVTHANILPGVTLNGMVYPVVTIYNWDTERSGMNLQTVSLPSTLKTIEYGAFNNCGLLKDITIPDGVTSIGNNSFQFCYSLETITIPNSVTSVGEAAFYGCSNLSTINLSESLKSIENSTFWECSKLQSITIPDGVTSIGRYAFYNCNSLKEIRIPSSVTTMGYYAFEGCYSLKSLYIVDLETWLNIDFDEYSSNPLCYAKDLYLNDSLVTELIIPNTISKIGKNQRINGLTSLSSVKIEAELTELPESFFSGCSSLKSVELPGSLTKIPNYLFNGCKQLKHVVIPSGVGKIGYHAFGNCVSLDSIIIPNSVLTIERSAFEKCTSLKYIKLPTNLTTISSRTFYNCSSLETIEIPNGVNRFGSDAFGGCSALVRLDIEDLSAWFNSKFENSSSNPLMYADSFYVNGVLKDTINVPEGVKTLKAYTLGEGSFLREFVLPSTIEILEYGSLPSGLLKLKCKATTPPALGGYYEYTEWGDTIWVEANSLGNIQTVFVPQNCRAAYKSVDPWASKVIVAGNGKTVNVHVAIPGMMGEEILEQAEYLSDVNFLTVSGILNDDDINNIKNSMPNLLTIDMSKTDMTSIPEKMFFDRKSLLDIILPSGIKSIESGAFHNCISLERIVLPEGLTTLAYGSYQDYWNNYTTIGCFSNCRSLKTISFPSTLRSVGSCAFYNCDALQNIEFKGILNSIGDYAFGDCSSLSKIQFPQKVGSFGSYVFIDCYSLKNVSMPKSIGTVYRDAFYNSRFLEKLEVDTLKYIENGAFYGSSLKEVIIKNGLVDIGTDFYDYGDEWYDDGYRRGAFENCYSLASVELPDNLKRIGNISFRNCNSLYSVNIPEGVSYIGQDAFANCSNLQTVNLPSTLSDCGSTPFLNCNKLTSVICTSLFPPVLADGLLSLENMGLAVERTLYVPNWTIKKYKLTSGWAAFSEILPLDNVYPDNIIIDESVTLSLPDNEFPEGYKPNMQLGGFGVSYNEMSMSYGYGGNLHLTGNNTLPLTTFNMYQSRYDNYAEWENYWGYTTTSVLLNEATIEADNVITDLELSSGHWHFLSFPYDVKVSDIKTSGDWVIRYYDGAARAKMDYNNTWVTVPYDGVLRAGQGYIWSSSNGSFTVPALDNENKNLIFANDTRRIPLEEYLSDYTSNNSWNLIGNPFPCYYDTRYMEYTAPITVWDRENRTYVAYSPVDDNYILTPLEAFFVQCPTGVDSVGFKADGRQTNTAVRTIPVAATAGAKSAPRQVFNVLLSNEQYTDRTRFVINSNAQRTYEMNCDAAKFMSSDAKAPQLFTVEGDDKLAINERPLADGKVALGLYVGSAGTYTLSLETSVNQEVTLIDHLTGEEVDMTTESYTFETETGTVDGRFTLLIGDGGAYSVDGAVTERVNVLPVDGGISVSAADGVEVVLYNAAGAQVGTGSGASVRFNVAPGLYVVKVGNASYKVSVNK